ncbi:MAG: hypothetical protein QNJ22_22545 [Desulfosarcinaceae bacterium]|nr:hypothetical protein [Desulfosarcinaceae bacterium]
MKLTFYRQIGIVAISLMCITAAHAGDKVVTGTKNFAEAIGFMAEERSLAESYASILNEFGKEDVRNYAKGIRLYAEARAKFEGLIEQLEYEIKNNQSPGTSTTFDTKLNQAAKQRVAFTDFVNKKIIRDDPVKKNPLIIAGIAAAPELIEALKEVGKTIWQEYREADQQEQQEILDQLESMKWRDFSEIAG